MKKYGINNEEKLKKKLENISLEEKDLINMYLDFDLIKSDKWEKTLEKRKKYRNKLYANNNPKSFNSTGNLATINELCQEEKMENNKDVMTTKNSKTNDNINSSGSDSDNISEGVKKFFTKKKSTNYSLNFYYFIYISFCVSFDPSPFGTIIFGSSSRCSYNFHLTFLFI